jgi:hypothetical protein
MRRTDTGGGLKCMISASSDPIYECTSSCLARAHSNLFHVNILKHFPHQALTLICEVPARASQGFEDRPG